MTSRPRPDETESAEIAPAEYLRRLGEKGDGPHALADAALMLAALDRPEKKRAPFLSHLTELAETVRIDVDFAPNGEFAVGALSSVIAGRFGYEGDRSHYDDPQNADLMAVIERRRGLPVALGILYIHAARSCGIQACGLLSPGHFLLRISVKGNEALLDPFNGGALVDREQVTGPGFGAPPHLPEPGAAEDLDPFMPVSDTDVLLRLQNNIKNRALHVRDIGRAIEIVRRMTVIAPRRNALWLELAHLQESTGSLSAARSAYETCLKLSRAGDDISNEAAFALHALKRRLN